MNRRTFLSASALAAAPALAAGAESSNQYLDLRFYDLHNGVANQRQRLTEFLEKEHLPMMKRLKAGPVGYFQISLGEDMPKIVTVSTYSSLAEIETRRAAQMADKEWVKALQDLKDAHPTFDRVESWLLRTFDAMPRIEVPPSEEGTARRVYLLRIYEAENFHKGALKVDMFNSGEIDIFRKAGFTPVFFAETLFGTKMPNLAYMVSYEDSAAGEAAWAAFRAHPDWKKMSSDPKWAGTTSNIANIELQPLPFSPMR
jgi:hypothetical protein